MKKVYLLLMVLIVFFISGCARIDSDIKINSDFSGTWLADVVSEVGPIPKTAIEAELSKIQISDYKLEPMGQIVKDKNDATAASQWKVTAKFKNAQELEKIAKTVFGANTPIYIKADAENNKVTDVNLGVSRTGTTKIHIDGDVVKESLTNGHIDKDGAIVFEKNDKIAFQYKENFPILQMVAIGIGVLVIIVFGFFYYQYNKKKKDVED